jgi:hypothetical protein
MGTRPRIEGFGRRTSEHRNHAPTSVARVAPHFLTRPVIGEPIRNTCVPVSATLERTVIGTDGVMTERSSRPHGDRLIVVEERGITRRRRAELARFQALGAREPGAAEVVGPRDEPLASPLERPSRAQGYTARLIAPLSCPRPRPVDPTTSSRTGDMGRRATLTANSTSVRGSGAAVVRAGCAIRPSRAGAGPDRAPCTRPHKPGAARARGRRGERPTSSTISGPTPPGVNQSPSTMVEETDPCPRSATTMRSADSSSASASST